VQFNRICVLGLGYIGLPTASTFATHDLEVIGVDVNQRVLDTLRNGGLHIQEPGLRTLVKAAIGSGNLSINQAPEPADAFIIAVPTPFLLDKRADLSYVVAAAEAILPHLRSGNLVVLESTSPPRTTVDVVAPILERDGLIAGIDFYLAYSPERVLPGQILRELIENARVIGGIDKASAEAGRDLYSIFVKGELLLTDTTTAEIVKLMENTYRDVNIAIANEFSRLADRFSIDVWEAISIANHHPRVDILRPGSGVGGHCIGVDPWFLVEAAPDITRLIRAAREVNDSQPAFVVDLICRALDLGPNEGLSGKNIAILGLAYKPDVDDLRESPAVEVVNRLNALGAKITAYEPFKERIMIPGADCFVEINDTIKDADLIALMVAHTSLLHLDPFQIIQQTRARLVVDCVNGWDAGNWRRAGFQYFRLGAPATSF